MNKTERIKLNYNQTKLKLKSNYNIRKKESSSLHRRGGFLSQIFMLTLLPYFSSHMVWGYFGSFCLWAVMLDIIFYLYGLLYVYCVLWTDMALVLFYCLRTVYWWDERFVGWGMIVDLIAAWWYMFIKMLCISTKCNFVSLWMK